jgi:hypothetical protein
VVALDDAAYDLSGWILADDDARGKEGIDLFSFPSSLKATTGLASPRHEQQSLSSTPPRPLLLRLEPPCSAYALRLPHRRTHLHAAALMVSTAPHPSPRRSATHSRRGIPSSTHLGEHLLLLPRCLNFGRSWVLRRCHAHKIPSFSSFLVTTVEAA